MSDTAESVTRSPATTETSPDRTSSPSPTPRTGGWPRSSASTPIPQGWLGRPERPAPTSCSRPRECAYSRHKDALPLSRRRRRLAIRPRWLCPSWHWYADVNVHRKVEPACLKSKDSQRSRWAGIIELLCGGLVLLGLFTRPAAILCSGAMAYAYFVVHQQFGLLPIQNKGELAAVYSWFFLLIAILGPGAFALDALRRRRGAALSR
jgi:uncharacterized membrane protein YphA (DoxX/SURF4 family)